MGTLKEQKAIDAVVEKFPPEFSLRGEEGRFRISRDNSFFTGPGECGGTLVLCTQRWRAPVCAHHETDSCTCVEPHGDWVDFSTQDAFELTRRLRR
jgi:hypothetical protein